MGVDITPPSTPVKSVPATMLNCPKGLGTVAGICQSRFSPDLLRQFFTLRQRHVQGQQASAVGTDTCRVFK